MAADQDEVAFERRLRDAMPHFGSPDLAPVQMADLFATLAATAAARAAWLGELLAEQVRVQGLSGLVGHRYGVDQVNGGTVELSEDLRALVVLEAAERDRAERLARDGLRIGIEAKQLDVMRGYGRSIAESLRAFALELGLEWSDAATRRAAQRAVLAARQNLGVDFASPDRVGPRLSPAERTRVLAAGAIEPATASLDAAQPALEGAEDA
jgi:hypothetical protein